MKVLIVALDAVETSVVEAEVLVVAPALNSVLRRWVSDDDAARRRAGSVAQALVAQLRRAGLDADGRVGDADPLLAIADALPTFPADVIVVVGRPEHSAELVARARRRFALPIRTATALPLAA